MSILSVITTITTPDPLGPAATIGAAHTHYSLTIRSRVVSFPETLRELERLHGIGIADSRAAVVPLALPDVEARAYAAFSGNVEILFVGRLEPPKGTDTLLQVIPEICTYHPNAGFTLIGADAIIPATGEVSYRQQFEGTAPPGVLDRVNFAGSLSDHVLNAALTRCDIFVTPSRFKSFGLMNPEGGCWQANRSCPPRSTGSNQSYETGRTAFSSHPAMRTPSPRR